MVPRIVLHIIYTYTVSFIIMLDHITFISSPTTPPPLLGYIIYYYIYDILYLGYILGLHVSTPGIMPDIGSVRAQSKGWSIRMGYLITDELEAILNISRGIALSS